MTHVLYLHGFMSSPHSEKATETKAYFEQHLPEVTLHIPEISNHPSEVASQLTGYIEAHPALLNSTIDVPGLRAIGSSMGGYLSTWLVEQYGGKAVLVNPAVRPYELLQGYLGDHVNPYSGKAFSLTHDDMDIIKALDTPQLKTPSAYKVLLQTGDETLDYRQAEQKYAQSHLVIEQGGDHRFVDYHNHLEEIAAFLS